MNTTLLKNSIRSKTTAAILSFSVALTLGVSLTTVQAANVWDGGGADNNWNTAGNWDNDTVPTSPAALTFRGVDRLTANNNLPSFTVSGITFTNNNSAGQTGQFTLTGNKLLLGGSIGGANSSGSLKDTIALDLEMTGTGNRTVTAANNRTLEISGVISENAANRILITAGASGTNILSGLNTFTGVMRISTGTTVMNTLANSGTASSAGAGSVIDLGQGTAGNDATLRYVGAATSTDRQINIGNTATNAGGGVIENNGSGTLTFSRATFNNTQGTVTANRTLTLGGTNNGVIAGAIQNNNAGALISLVKKDAGTWTLNGTNTYTGTTTVNAGKLLINGSTHTNSTLTVSTNATLGGSGTIGGATTISGTHSPGNSPGIQTFSSNLTYTNSANVLWELTANTTTQGSPAPVFDQIVVGGNLDFASPTTLTLNFNYTGSTVDWSNALWKSDISGAAGWLLYDVSGTLSNFTNLSIVTENWVDASGTLFNTALSGSSFSLYQEGNDIYLNYAVPEPSTYAMLVLSAAGLGAHVIRRRRRGC